MPHPPDMILRPEFLKGALPQAAFWGRLALSVGITGLGASLLLILVHLRDQFSIKRNERNPTQFSPSKWGLLNQSLGEFFKDPVRNAPLSADAAAEFVIGRLEAQRDVVQSVIRYFSYAPLLLGLMGTIFSLRALLVDSGNTLQQIQPQLAGVFAGTLAGIIGSLVAALGALLLDYATQSTINQTQDFVHRHIIPTLPERRISIRIEDAVLALIAERTRVVAESFNNALRPVATQMAEIASRCSKAAESATEAFTQATRALREAGNLEDASRRFKAGAHMIDSSAEQLSDATKQTAEVILRVGELRNSFEQLTGHLHASATALADSSKEASASLGTHITELNVRGEKVHDSVGSLSSALNSLAAELQLRARTESSQLDVIKTHAEVSGRALLSITDMAKQSSDMLKTLPERVQGISGLLVDGVRQGVSSELDRLTKTLDSVVGPLEKGVQFLANATPDAKHSDENGFEAVSVELNKTLRDVTTEFRRASEESRKFTEFVQRIRLTVDSKEIPTRKKPDGLFGWLRR